MYYSFSNVSTLVYGKYIKNTYRPARMCNWDVDYGYAASCE